MQVVPPSLIARDRTRRSSTWYSEEGIELSITSAVVCGHGALFDGVGVNFLDGDNANTVLQNDIATLYILRSDMCHPAFHLSYEGK
jgi:hypothetical protein